MFVWRKRASAVWLAANEAALREIGGQRLAITSRPDCKTAIAEIAGSSRRDLEKIRSRFGGTIEKLPRDWLKEFSQSQKSEPIKIGNRLTIYRSVTSKNRSRNKSLLIPSGRAFGTGEHPTTAMSLRLLERCTRFWGAQAASLHSSAACRRRLFKEGSAGSRTQQGGSLRSPEPKRTLLDLGTGTGILALAAKRLGAARVIAIDHDPVAIATARENARRNKLNNVDFRVADVRRWPFPPRIEIITANLFSELLIEILPKLKRAQRLILSGILRDQEAQLVRALKRNGIVIVEMRRRGKWIAILAQQIKERRLPSRRSIINGGLETAAP
jgi:ribosomal protein L11 methyltransferase